MIVTSVVPFMLMLFLNLFIMYFYKKNSQLIRQATSNNDQDTATGSKKTRRKSAIANKKKNQEATLFLLFFCLTATFLLCHLPRLVLNIQEVGLNRRRQRCRADYNLTYAPPTWMYIAGSVEQLALVFNSSVNFVFYCWLGRNFRRQMAQTLLVGPCRGRGPGPVGRGGDSSSRRKESSYVRGGGSSATQVEMEEVKGDQQC